MDYPLIGRELLDYLKIGHGLFNFSVMLMFFYTARFGLRIRKARLSGAPTPVAAMKRHRFLGPRLAILGGLGFTAGLTLVLLDSGNILKYPGHFLVGLTIVTLLLITFLVSRKIKGPDSPYRQPHFLLGLTILTLYLLEVVLGLGVLL